MRLEIQVMAWGRQVGLNGYENSSVELECSVNDIYKVSISDISYFMTNCFVFMHGEETCLHDCGYMI
jgi:hypothetical protein